MLARVLVVEPRAVVGAEGGGRRWRSSRTGESRDSWVTYTACLHICLHICFYIYERLIIPKQNLATSRRRLTFSDFTSWPESEPARVRCPVAPLPRCPAAAVVLLSEDCNHMMLLRERHDGY